MAYTEEDRKEFDELKDDIKKILSGFNKQKTFTRLEVTGKLPLKYLGVIPSKVLTAINEIIK